MDNQFRNIDQDQKSNVLYDSGALHIIILACVIILVSVVSTGILSYNISRNAVIDQLKTRDLPNMIQAMTNKMDGRLQRARETSLQLATDPALREWITGRETDRQLGQYAQTELFRLGHHYDYENCFIVSALTSNYWAENGSIIGSVSPNNPFDTWFYTALESGNRITVNMDYNEERQITSVFVNTLMGDINQPVAVVGVGLSLEQMAAEFRREKTGANSSLWLIDDNGKICLSDDVSFNGRMLQDFLPTAVLKVVLTKDPSQTISRRPVITEFTDAQGKLIDLAYQPLKYAPWTLVYQIPREESLAVVKPIQTNTIATSGITVALLIVIFFIVSRRIANPYKRALLVNAELERLVDLRTQELTEQNEKIMDSIDYAQRIQEAMLPASTEMDRLWGEHFVLWKPRDIVGGDFYWARDVGHGRLVIIGDCTGHGVPGALMTMTVISMIDRIVDNTTADDPALILQELNRLLYKMLQGANGQKRLDEGLDAGVCYLSNDGAFLFAGAKIGLYQVNSQGIKVYSGARRSIGHRRNPERLVLENQIVNYEQGDAFYLTTDGYLDQNDSENNYCYGTKRYRSLLAKTHSLAMDEQAGVLEEELLSYMQGEDQRDDITVIGFRL